MAHKGARTDKHREADHPYAVDIPIGGNGLGQNLNRIVEASRALPGGAEHWGQETRLADGTRQRWCRVGTKLAEDADRFAAEFRRLDARRVR
jgi:hypothetical protein